MERTLVTLPVIPPGWERIEMVVDGQPVYYDQPDGACVFIPYAGDPSIPEKRGVERVEYFAWLEQRVAPVS